MWLDGSELSFANTQTPGDYCAGQDCELRGTGPTPLAGSLQAAQDFLVPIRSCDGAVPCRKYAVILLTDGAESCLGDPVAAATALFDAGIELFVIGFSVQTSEVTQLNQISRAGSGSARDAFLVGNESQLVNALATIVAGSIVFERCNGLDDDCDTLVDEDFPDRGEACTDGDLGLCLGTGTRVCNSTQDGTVCQITDPGASPGMEVCNGVDDNCNGLIDEGLSCTTPCTPSGPEVCDGVDNDCDDAVDEEDPMLGASCGVTDTPPCRLGQYVCIGGTLQCVGNVDPSPTGETCNGIDDDCDGTPDDMAPCPGTTSCIDGECRLACGSDEFACPVGFECVTEPQGRFCEPTPCAACVTGEVCQDNMCVNQCEGVTCAANETCSAGLCYDCRILGCPTGQLCYERLCQVDACAQAGCGPLENCVDGQCLPGCSDADCPSGQRCDATGTCADDPCASVECTGSEVCVGGACVADPCGGVTCGVQEVCVGGTCVSDPCRVIVCAAGRVCEVDPVRGAQCVVGGDVPAPQLVLASGASCGCRVGGAGAPPGSGAVLLCFLALALTRRRRS